jgi:hypothetical protein
MQDTMILEETQQQTLVTRLNRISLAVFKHHIETCIPEGVEISQDEARKRLGELVDIFDRFSK